MPKARNIPTGSHSKLSLGKVTCYDEDDQNRSRGRRSLPAHGYRLLLLDASAEAADSTAEVHGVVQGYRSPDEQ